MLNGKYTLFIDQYGNYWCTAYMPVRILQQKPPELDTK